MKNLLWLAGWLLATAVLALWLGGGPDGVDLDLMVGSGIVAAIVVGAVALAQK